MANRTFGLLKMKNPASCRRPIERAPLRCAAKRGAAVLIVLLTFTALPGCSAESTGPVPDEAPETQRVTLAGRAFELDLALTPEARAQGLMGRESIAEDGGMLFVFPDSEARQFWMKDCLVPIDLIYLSPSGRIVSMHQMQVPDPGAWRLKRYPSRWPAQYAIELKGGTLDELGLSPGERIDLPHESLKQRAR